MTARYPLLYRTVQGLGLLLALLSLLAPGLLAQMQFWAALGLIVLIGIPHGATDYLIFQHLVRPRWGKDSMLQFYACYLAIMGGYALAWYVLPQLSLLFFLFISMYHFGQSNWNYADLGPGWKNRAAHFIWGAFVLSAPILWHYEAAIPIIAHITGEAPPAMAVPWRRVVVGALFIINFWASLYYFLEGAISWRDLRNEVFNLIVLAIVLTQLPLLLGFAVYFVGWHSLSSMMDQIRFFRDEDQQYGWRHYFKNALPLTAVAIAGLAALAWLQNEMALAMNIGLVFVFISVVTLPHMLLIDQLYKTYDSP